MLATVMVTFEEKEEFYIRAVLKEIKQTYDFNVRRITIGQLFEKRAASIFLPESQLQNVFDKLIANEIEIYPFNNQYKERIASTKERISRLGLYKEEIIRSEYFRGRRQRGLNVVQNDDSIKNISVTKPSGELPKEVKEQLTKVNVNTTGNEPLDVYVKEGNYIIIRNMIKNNPLQNEKIKEKYIPAIKSSIKLHFDKAIKDDALLDESITKLKEIICDSEIKAIKSHDFIGEAGDSLIKLCATKNKEELISLINLPSIGQRLNVMAAIKLAELIFEKGNSNDDHLLKYAKEKINRRFLLTSFDVIEPSISELNKSRFNLLMNSIQEMAA